MSFRLCRCLLVLALVVFAAFSTDSVTAADSLPRLDEADAPSTVAELWGGYDPRQESLEVETVKAWRDGNIELRYVRYTVGQFRGQKSRLAAFYAYPKNGQTLPGLLHIHGGGQRANLRIVTEFARRGYATLSVNWGGRAMEGSDSQAPNTDWGAVDPTQQNVRGYSSMLPNEKTIDDFESPRNNNWFLLTIGCRRGITFLEQQAQVDANRIGVMGHSMGGRLTGLVAGCDSRVKAASPSVGGSGFLQHDLWGLPRSARKVRGDLATFQGTLAGQAYLRRVKCPILFLSATNDFNAPLDFVQQGMATVAHNQKRTVYSPHLNHRFTPTTDVSRKLWFDSHLQRRLEFPDSPQLEIILDDEGGVPICGVTPDASREIEQVNLYYGYERDPRNRFWAAAEVSQEGASWIGACPVFDLGEPLFVLANIQYKLKPDERYEGDPETFVLSATQAVYPQTLRSAGIQATEQTHRLIDDFPRGLHDWYVLQANNAHHWLYATRKLADPRWGAPANAKLALELETTAENNSLGVQVVTDSWRSYAGRRSETYTTIVALPKAGRQRVLVSPASLRNVSGKQLGDWDGITELRVLPADKAVSGNTELRHWNGRPPQLLRLEWQGGEPTKRRKPFLPASGDAKPAKSNKSGLADPEFNRAIEQSIKQEKLDEQNK